MIQTVWIARDDDGRLFLYKNKPRKENYYWYPADDDYFSIDNALFPEIKKNDPEPTKVQIEIIK